MRNSGYNINMKTICPTEQQLDEALVYDEQVSKDKDQNKSFNKSIINYDEYKQLVYPFGRERLDIICDEKLELTVRFKPKGINANFGRRLFKYYAMKDIENCLLGARSLYEKQKVQSTIFDYYTLPRQLSGENEEDRGRLSRSSNN